MYKCIKTKGAEEQGCEKKITHCKEIYDLKCQCDVQHIGRTN